MTRPSRSKVRTSAILAAGIVLLASEVTFAQGTPATGSATPDDTPSIKVGAVIFADYTYTSEPTILDVDGNEVHPSAFDVKRAFINVTGRLHHLIDFRVTPDIVRETGSGGSADGSLVLRLKYAYGQFNLDDSWSKGSWVRLGEQPTPYVLYEEDIYRYRFQGPIFVDAEKFMTVADFGVSTRYNFPGNFGDFHAGYFNGDGYTKADANDQKAIQARATLRPVPNRGVISGLRLTLFYDADHYAQGDAKTRLVGSMSFEHKHVNAGLEHLDATDQTTGASPEVKASGWSVWVTPRFPKGWEGLLRLDNLKPDQDVAARKVRKIAGIAYWFRTQTPDAVSLLLDYETVTYDSPLAAPDEKRYALHALFKI